MVRPFRGLLYAGSSNGTLLPPVGIVSHRFIEVAVCCLSPAVALPLNLATPAWECRDVMPAGHARMDATFWLRSERAPLIRRFVCQHCPALDQQ